jgi:hypothetical protein
MTVITILHEILEYDGSYTYSTVDSYMLIKKDS